MRQGYAPMVATEEAEFTGDQDRDLQNAALKSRLLLEVVPARSGIKFLRKHEPTLPSLLGEEV